MEEQNKCYRIVRSEVPCSKQTPKGVKCFKESKIEKPCKKRCINGELAKPTKDGRYICKHNHRKG